MRQLKWWQHYEIMVFGEDVELSENGVVEVAAVQMAVLGVVAGAYLNSLRPGSLCWPSEMLKLYRIISVRAQSYYTLKSVLGE